MMPQERRVTSSTYGKRRDIHSVPGGGGNAPKRCFPVAIKQTEEVRVTSFQQEVTPSPGVKGACCYNPVILLVSVLNIFQLSIFIAVFGWWGRYFSVMQAETC